MTTIDTGTLNQLGLSSGAAAPARDQLGQEEFLKLMITQLTNQDPFKPMESSQFLGQLAQFGTVSGISDMQKSLGTMADDLGGNRTLQAATLVDRQVLVPAREAWLPPDGVIHGAVDVADGIANPTVEVVDLSGQGVARIALSDPAGGTADFEWDGTLPNGQKAEPGFYELRAAGDVDGESQALNVMVAGRVESVAVRPDGQSLGLTVTGLGQVDLSQVRRIQ